MHLWSRYVSGLAVAVCLTACAAPRVLGQDVVQLHEAPSDQLRPLRVRRLTVIRSSSDDTVSPGLVRSVVPHRDGRFVITFESRATPAPALYSAQGDLLRWLSAEDGHAFGSPVSLALMKGDSVLAVDTERGRGVVYGSDDLRPTRSFDIDAQGLLQVTALSDGSIIGDGIRATASDAGYPLFHFDATGHLQSRFGVTTAIWLADQADGMLRRVAISQTGFWAAHTNEYVIEHWSNAEVLQTVFRRTVPWLADIGRATEPDNPLRARPYISAIEDDGAGHLWVVALILSDNGAAAAKFQRKPRIVGGSQAFLDVPDHIDKLYRTHVEVIDIQHGTIIAQGNIDAALVRFVRPGLAIAVHEVKDGSWICELWRVSIGSLSAGLH